MGFATDAIHAGQPPDPTTGAIMTPIYQTSTYVQEELGKHKGFEYARTQNPTRLALERCLATLDKGERGFAFASGMSAIAAVLNLLRAGELDPHLGDFHFRQPADEQRIQCDALTQQQVSPLRVQDRHGETHARLSLSNGNAQHG